MKHLFQTAALVIAATSGSVLAEGYHTGLADLAIHEDVAGRPLEGFVWYPTAQNDGLAEHHTNPVWQGIEAVKDATPLEGRYPLVVLSHGMYGNAMNQTWLADALVGEGYIVAAINHPGTSTWLRDPEDARQMWERPRDVSRVIDHLLDDPAYATLVDPERIYMGGHSLGGFTAVALAGGRYDADKMDGFCAEQPDDLVCGIFERWQLAKTPQDVAALGADLSDPRISRFAIFDLGGTQSFSQESLAGIDRPLLVIGAPRDIAGLDLDIESRALRDALPEATVTYMEPQSLSHFDFLGVCKAGAMDILAQEEPGDEVICLQGGAARLADHAMIAKAVAAHFQ